MSGLRGNRKHPKSKASAVAGWQAIHGFSWRFLHHRTCHNEAHFFFLQGKEGMVISPKLRKNLLLANGDLQRAVRISFPSYSGEVQVPAGSDCLLQGHSCS